MTYRRFVREIGREAGVREETVNRVLVALRKTVLRYVVLKKRIVEDEDE